MLGGDLVAADHEVTSLTDCLNSKCAWHEHYSYSPQARYTQFTTVAPMY